MAKDLHMLRDLFEETLGADPKRTDAKARVDRIFRQLTDIHDLAGAKDEQEFIECWNDVLTNDPSKGIGIVVRRLFCALHIHRPPFEQAHQTSCRCPPVCTRSGKGNGGFGGENLEGA